MKLNHPFFRSHERTPQLSSMFDRRTDTFQNPTPTTEETDRVLEAMALIAPSRRTISRRWATSFSISKCASYFFLLIPAYSYLFLLFSLTFFTYYLCFLLITYLMLIIAYYIFLNLS